MPSPRTTAPHAADRNEGLATVLDPAFGFFVWAIHLLTVYVGAAVACVLGLGAAGTAARTAFYLSLLVFTAMAVALVLVHAWRRHRQQRTMQDLRFRMTLTVGCDTVAAMAIAWQLYPILLAPLCR